MNNNAEHWEGVYRTRSSTDVSWYRPHLDVSLELIERAVADRNARIIDVGAGESTLIDDLLARGYRSLSALDLSATAIDVVKARLGANAAHVALLCGDVRTYPLMAAHYDLWHDRAVFHFLTRAADRTTYVTQVRRAVKPGGSVIIGTFGPQGPLRCSGLDVMRYDADALAAEFGSGFRRMDHRTEVHRTPSGATQQFIYCWFSVVAS